MTPAEFWLIHEAKRPRDPEQDYAGTLRDDDVSDLWAMMNER